MKKIRTFFDYGGEWLIAPLIAQQNKEGHPIFVCEMDESEGYSLWPQLNDYEPSATYWFQHYVDRLTLIKRFGQYMIYELTDINAFHGIWLRCSENHSIGRYLFSADCDLDRLTALLGQNAWLKAEDLKTLASWSYWQQYGGGSDEHFAYYFSENAENQRAFSHYLLKEHFSARYQHINTFMLSHTQASHFANSLIQQGEQMFLLFKEPLKSYLDISNSEEHEVWWYKSADRTGFHYEDEDYQEFLDHKKAIAEGLSAINSLRVYDTFIHGEYRYKILVLTDWSVVNACWTAYDFCGYIEGVFSWDSDLTALKKRIMAQKDYAMPETLTHLGRFAIFSMRDHYSTNDDVIMFCAHQPYLDQILEGMQQYYIQSPVNDRAINYR